MAESYIGATSLKAGAAADLADAKKTDKYTDLPANYFFQPIAVESLGPVSSSTTEFLGELGRRISLVSGDPRETSFLWQRLSICIQRFNSILLHQSFVDPYEEPD